jgi:hypothetical protein
VYTTKVVSSNIFPPDARFAGTGGGPARLGRVVLQQRDELLDGLARRAL